jgi:hypothetical protein
MTFSGDMNNGLVDGLVARYAGDSPNKHCATLLSVGWNSRVPSILFKHRGFGVAPRFHRDAP